MTTLATRRPLRAARRRRIALYILIVAGGTLAALSLAGISFSMAVSTWTY